MKPKLTEQSECKFVAEFDPPPLFLLGALNKKVVGGFNSQTTFGLQFTSLTFRKLSAH